MKVCFFSARSYDEHYFTAALSRLAEAGAPLNFLFQEARLEAATAGLASGCSAVCVFVNDQVDQTTLTSLHDCGVKLVALRCAGYNNVDLAVAAALGIGVVHVPAYSPEAVAEHTVALILALNRKIYRAYARVREGNFSLEGLVGFNLHGKVVGLIGTGRIGSVVARVLGMGFCCKLLGTDPMPNPACVAFGLKYVELGELLAESDIISLHTPLFPSTLHLVDEAAVAAMKAGVMLINTSRGGLIDTRAVIRGLKTRKIGSLGLDVYEEEAALFFEDRSMKVISDDVFSRLLTFPNVLITAHQAFLTAEGLTQIAETTAANIQDFLTTGLCRNQIVPRPEQALRFAGTAE